jgi:hypothetical protein
MFTSIFGHVHWMRILKTKKFNLKTKSKKTNWVDLKKFNRPKTCNLKYKSNVKKIIMPKNYQIVHTS